jgi:hypothetical protein
VLGRRKQYRGQPDRFFLRDWPRKWIGGRDGRGRVFQLDEDPLEQGGTAGTALPEALRGAIDASGAAPAQPPVRDAEARRALEALGYLE